MAKAGLRFSADAGIADDEATGRIAKGMDADLVVLSDDPDQDVKAFSRVAYTVRAGKIVFGRE